MGGMGDLGGALGDADAWIVDLDLGGLADLLDIAVVAGLTDLADDLGDLAVDGAPVAAGHADAPSLLAHDLVGVPDGADPFAALADRRLDDAEFLNEVRHLRIRSPFPPSERATEPESAAVGAAVDESDPSAR
jgi:hypothetical protein